MRLIPILLISLGVLLAGCDSGQQPILHARLEEGTTIAQKIGDSDAVVLVYSPDECFACYGAIWEWIQWGRGNPGRLTIVFTRQPTAQERLGLAAMRIRPDAVLASGQGRGLKSPSEYLFQGGRVVYESSGSIGRLTTNVVRRGSVVPLNGLAAPPPAVSRSQSAR